MAEIVQPQEQAQAQPAPAQPQGPNPVIEALGILQAYVLQQKEQNKPNVDQLMLAFKAFLDQLQGGGQEQAPQPAPTPAPQPAPAPVQVPTRQGVMPMNMGQRGLNQGPNTIPVI